MLPFTAPVLNYCRQNANTDKSNLSDNRKKAYCYEEFCQHLQNSTIVGWKQKRPQCSDEKVFTFSDRLRANLTVSLTNRDLSHKKIYWRLKSDNQKMIVMIINNFWQRCIPILTQNKQENRPNTFAKTKAFSLKNVIGNCIKESKLILKTNNWPSFWQSKH